MIAIGIVVAGGLVGHLGATSATTLEGGKGDGSFDTGLYITITTIFAGFTAIRALPLAKRWGRDASGPGMVLAGMSLGKLLTPRVVDRIESSGRSDAVGAMWAALGVAVLLYAFTISTPLLSDVPELAVWVLIGIGFGALRATVISMNEGAAVTAMPKDMAMEGMAVLAMAVTFTSPVAAFSWGWSIQQIGAIPTVFIGATLMVISLVLLRLLFLRTVASTEASPY